MNTTHPTQTPEYWEREAVNARLMAIKAEPGESRRIYMRDAWDYEEQAAKLRGWGVNEVIAQIELAVDAAKKAHSDMDLSFGYIGNLYRDSTDDRGWCVFVKFERSRCINSTSWGSFSTDNLVHMLGAIRAGELDRFIERLNKA